MRTGTANFVSKTAALHYYEAYYHDFVECAVNVAEMIETGQIHIGAPDTKPGEHLVIVDNGRRYAIETEESSRVHRGQPSTERKVS